MTFEELKAEAAQGKKWCYDCKHFYSDKFCGYNACNCKIYGSLDVDQHVRHPDKTADICPDYSQKSIERWYEKYNKNSEAQHG